MSVALRSARTVWPSGLAAAFVIAAVVLRTYGNSLQGPFVFDDLKAIPENASIRHLFSWDVWSPPADATVAGRPILNLSLAINYAFGGSAVLGYHVANLVIHVAAALALLGLLRRTPSGLEHSWVPFGATLIWALHPLQTESVTYVVQRAESLMGLFYLLTLYAFVRGSGCHPLDDKQSQAPGKKEVCHLMDDNRVRRKRAAWLVVSVAACALGMATKEAMVTAPLLVVLYDRTFLAGSFSTAWRQRWRFYTALAATWLVLAAVVWHAGDRAGTAGFSAGVAPLDYARAQARAIVHYVKLAVWPRPLVFDYGPYVTGHLSELWPDVALIGAGLIAVVVVERKRPALGFAGAAFFLLLAPTSSVLPIATEPMAEHRMYLPLAALAVLAATGIERVNRQATPWLCGALGLALGIATIGRNADYHSEHALWTATVVAAPGNPRAQSSLAWALLAERDRAGAEVHFRAALASRADYVDAHRGLARILEESGRARDAEAEYRAVLRSKPDDFIAHNALGLLAFQSGDLAAAVEHFERAVATEPRSAVAHNNLGSVLYESGDFPAAQAQEETAVRLQPGFAEAHFNLGNALARQNQTTAARERYQRALSLNPDYAEAHAHLGVVLQNLGETAAAIAEYREALRMRPELAFVRQNLESLLAAPGRR